MSTLAHTSVPAWAVTPTTPAVDPTGRRYTVITVGQDASGVADIWLAGLGPLGPGAVRHIAADDADGAVRALQSELTEARVGWRLLVAGPAGACLGLRAAALRAGVEEDEMVIASTALGGNSVYCAHCGEYTRSDAAVNDTVACRGCRRNLLIHHHVARRTGSYLGFMADAEEPVR